MPAVSEKMDSRRLRRASLLHLRSTNGFDHTDETAITYRNEDTTAEDLRVGRRVIALGRFAEDSIKLKALRIEIRTGK